MTDIRTAFCQAGVPVEVLNGHLQALIRYGLIQANTLTTLSDDTSSTDEFTAIESLHITAAGKYYKDTLAWDFQYLRQVIPDTPIFQRSVFQEVDALFSPYKSYNFLVPLEKALLAVEKFTAYLRTEESAEHSYSPLGSGGPLQNISFFPAASGTIQSTIAHIRRALTQARSGSSGLPAGNSGRGGAGI